MASLFVQYLAIYRNEHFPNSKKLANVAFSNTKQTHKYAEVILRTSQSSEI